jgi:diketogulonate reductase-like aldo/keto reductase
VDEKQLGRTGVFIPEVGIGTWNYNSGPGALRSGFEAGARFIDTAESYGTEEVVREAVKGIRNQVFIATKVSPQNFRKTDLHKSVNASLSKLGIDTLDLLQLHEPNPSIPIQETVGAMNELVDSGKIRFIGVSNFSVVQLNEAQLATGKHPIVSNQVRYNLIDRTVENGLLQYCQSNGITIISYSPLARGLARISDCDQNGVIIEVARQTGKTAAQVILNWCLCKDGVIVIPGSNSERHVLENCGASGWRLTPDQIRLLESQVHYRHRNRFDKFVRKHMPRSLEGIAIDLLNRLPAGLRRRLT